MKYLKIYTNGTIENLSIKKRYIRDIANLGLYINNMPNITGHITNIPNIVILSNEVTLEENINNELLHNKNAYKISKCGIYGNFLITKIKNGCTFEQIRDPYLKDLRGLSKRDIKNVQKYFR